MLKKIGIIVLVLTGITVFSCSKDSTSSKETQKPPELPAIPQASVPDNAPAEVQTLRTTMTGFFTGPSAFMQFLMSVEPTRSGDEWIWTKQNNNLTITVKAKSTNDDRINWQLFLNGTDGFITYDDWRAVNGYASPDDKSATWEIYALNDTTVAANYSWDMDQDGNVESELESNSSIIKIYNNADGSGKLEHYKNDVLVFEAVWNAAGSGSWKKYDAEGNLMDQGSWQ